MDRFVNHTAVMRAEILTDDNASTGRKAGEKSDQHVDNRSDRPDGGKRLCRNEVADNDRVNGVVQLLKQISDQQRQCKSDQLFPDHPFGHIHSLFSSLSDSHDSQLSDIIFFTDSL